MTQTLETSPSTDDDDDDDVTATISSMTITSNESEVKVERGTSMQVEVLEECLLSLDWIVVRGVHEVDVVREELHYHVGRIISRV